MQRYDDKTALLVIDVQNDFADPKGSLSVAGGVPAIPSINTEVAMATSAEALVVATQGLAPRVDPHFQKTAASGLSTASAGRGARSRIPTCGSPTTRSASTRATGGEDGYPLRCHPTTGEEMLTDSTACSGNRASSGSR